MTLTNSAALRSLLACSVMLLSVGYASGQVTSAELVTALQHAKTGELNVRDAVVLANARAVEAIPALESKFRQSKDLDDKVNYALALVRLRDPDDQYWKLLQSEAIAALDSHIPYCYSPSSGKDGVIRRPELQAWADLHHVPFETACYDATYAFPGRILSIAMTGDARSLPLLRRALQSEDFVIVAFAAKGLAFLADQSSVPQIIAAARRFPLAGQIGVAEALIYFENARAQQAADELLPSDRVAIERKAKADGCGVFGYE